MMAEQRAHNQQGEARRTANDARGKAQAARSTAHGRPADTGGGSGGGGGVVPPQKYYSTGEVMEHTQLSRQTLHNYKRLGLIVPAKWTPSGHCHYDESVFERLRKIKLYQRYNSLQEIKELLDREEPLPDEAAAGEHEAADSKATAATTSANANAVESGEETVDVPDANLPSAKQWSDDAEHAPELAQELLRARRFPRKLYRIGDIMRLTGYSRQTLHNYTIQGLLTTKDRTASGHRLYGADAFTVLRLIEVFKRHRRFSEVQALIEQWRKFGRPLPGSGTFDADNPHRTEQVD